MCRIDDITIKINGLNPYNIETMGETFLETFYEQCVGIYFGKYNGFDWQKYKIHYDISETSEIIVNDFQQYENKYYKFENADKFIEMLTNENDFDIIMLLKDNNFMTIFNIRKISSYNEYIFCKIGNENLLIDKNNFIEFFTQLTKLNNFFKENKLILFTCEHSIDDVLRDYTADELKDYYLHFTGFYSVVDKEFVQVNHPKFRTIIGQIKDICPDFIYEHDYKIEN